MEEQGHINMTEPFKRLRKGLAITALHIPMMLVVILPVKLKKVLLPHGYMKMNNGVICLQVMTDKRLRMMKLEIRLLIETVCPLLGKKVAS